MAGYKLASSQYSGLAGISSATSATTLTDATAPFTANASRGHLVQSTAGGFPTRAKVASNTTSVLTVDAQGWDQGTPDAGQPYVVSNLQEVIGNLFHVGFGNGSQWYGYIFEPSEGKDGGFHERSDVAAKQQLIQYSSPNIIDRDFVYNPRVSQGDASGGMGQAVLSDFSKYWDSTLDVRSPGYLTSWPGWNSISVQATLVGALLPQVVSIGGKLFVTYGESNFHVYTVTPPATIVTNTGDIVAKSIDTDGYYLYLTNGTKIEQRVATAFGTNVVVTTAGTVTTAQIWAIQQGTNGRWIFYSDQAFPQSSLYRVDLNAALPSAGAQVPLGSMVGSIVDLVSYQNGVAILTVGGTGSGAKAGWDLWFFDGVNTTPIFHRDGYTAFGICNCQGVLYVTENPSIGTYGRTQLVAITSGSASTVVSLGTPPNFPNQALVGPPRAVGSQVYFATSSAAVRSIVPMYLVAYNPTTGAVSHTDGAAPTPTGFRTLTSEGEAAILAYISAGVGGLFYQATGAFGAGGGVSPSLVGVAGAIVESANNTISPAFGQATSAGNLLVLAVSSLTASSSAFTLSGVTGWSRAVQQSRVANGRVEWWYKPNCAAGEPAPTITGGTPTTHMSAQLSEWTGAAALLPLDTTGGNASGDAANLTVTTAGLIASANEIALAAFQESRLTNTTGVWTPGATWTNLGNNFGTSQQPHLAVDYLANPTSGVVLSELGASNIAGPNRNWIGAMVTFLPATTPIAFGSGGKLVTSRIDFNTPGIEKRFRRLEAVHAPIPANCSLQIDCYVDKDPLAFTTGLVPDATVTNATVGSIATDFFLANLIGHSAYFVFTFLTTDNVSTITLNWYSVEISTPRAWEMSLACTNIRRTLSQEQDTQGASSKDLADFWLDAWENPKRLTMFLRDGFAYTVALESFERWNPSPLKPRDNQNPDEEYIVKVVLRQTLADS